VRFGVLEDIRINSPEPDTMSAQFDRDLSPGAFTINGPAATLEGAIDVSQINVNFGWQAVVDLFHEDEETRTECYNNADQVESCRRFRDECAPGCSARPADQQAACLDECAAMMPEEMRGSVQAQWTCWREISDEMCSPDDRGCREAMCMDQSEGARHHCEPRDWCEEVREPTPTAADVDGVLSIVLPGLSGGLSFVAADDVITLNNLGAGDETMHISVNDDRIIGVDLNSASDRRLGVMVSGQPNDNLRLQLASALDLSVMLALVHINDAIDMPDFMQDETIRVTFNGAETPTLESIGTNDDDREMRVSAGLLTFASTVMETDVVIGEGMCMGSPDDEELTEEERDARHDLFGEVVAEACGG
jgi:hypothetical protein